MEGPHQDQPRATAGAPLGDAEAAVLLCHGRGATARSILGMAEELETAGEGSKTVDEGSETAGGESGAESTGVDPERIAFVAPQAAGNTWYPNSFMAPIESNQPHLRSALAAVAALVADVEAAGVPIESTVLLGFSQGACLASEFVARNPRRYGGLAALSGGLIGPSLDRDSYEGSLEGTPAFLGCSDVDPHIPAERVDETASVLEALGAEVTERLYEGMGHGVNRDELAFVARMVGAVVA